MLSMEDYINEVAYKMQTTQRRHLDDTFFEILAEYGIERNDNWLIVNEQMNKAGIQVTVDIDPSINGATYRFHVYKKIATPRVLKVTYDNFRKLSI